MTMNAFPVGSLVVNLTTVVAKVVAIHADGSPILKVWDGKKAKGGKWVADPAKTRLATPEEIAAPWKM